MKLRILFFGLTILICGQAFSIEAVSHYELAIKSHSAGKNDEAYIYLKNAIQLNPAHLPSKLLLGKIFFEVGNIPAAEKELQEAYKLGADINLILPLLGTSLILQKKVDELLQFEDKYYQLDQDNKFEWHLLRGQAYLIESKADLADFEFREAINLFPNKPRALNTLSSLYIKLNQFDKAELLVKKSLALNSQNEKTWQLQGELFLTQKNPNDALESFLNGYNLAPDDPKILRNLTSLYLSNNDVEKANIYNEKIIEQSPNDLTANLIKAWFLKNQSKSKEAEAILTELSQNLTLIDSSDTSLIGNHNYVQGVTEYMLGNFKVAENALLKHLGKFEQDVKSIQVLANIYIESEQLDEALKLLESHDLAVMRNLNLGILLINLYIQQDNIFRAEKTFNELDQHFPDTPYLNVIRAKIYDLRGDSAAALAMLNGIKLTKPNLQYSLLKGKLLIQSGKIDQAKLIAQSLYNTNKANTDVVNLMSAIWIAEKDFPKAQKYIQQVLDLSPENLTANYNAALILLKQTDFKGAKDILEKSLETAPSHSPTLLQLANIDLNNGDIKNAENWLNKLLAYNPSHRVANQELFKIYVSQKRWDEALNINSFLLTNDRLDASLLIQKALLLHETRDQQGAVRNFNLVYELWLDDANKLKTLAQYQLSADDKSGAEKSILKALEITQDNNALKIELAKVKLSLNQFDFVKKVIKELKKKDVNTEEFYLLQGQLAKQMGQLVTAAKLFHKTLALYPKSPIAILESYGLAQQNIATNKFITHIEELLELEPDLHWCRKLLADLYLDSGNWAEAEKHYQLLLTTSEQYAQSPSILNNLANIYAKTDLVKARNTALTAIENGGNKSAAILDTMGWILAKEKNYSEALGYLREAYSLNSKNAETRYHLGYVLFHLDRTTEAVEQLKAAVKVDNFTEYEDAVILLNNLQQ
ncbi:PEP-CTERM system TPR-repeat protein PrsT [Alteromonadaceae bacterium BrNp21-10]|nr:PEP-CTERM system TPR-repeat protein PrsT [Alteromonadaceae bacterium BrNp21-10]